MVRYHRNSSTRYKSHYKGTKDNTVILRYFIIELVRSEQQHDILPKYNDKIVYIDK